jgi:hypothetical protein
MKAITSLNEQQNWTELRVICTTAGECGKLPCQPCGLSLIHHTSCKGRNNGIKMGEHKRLKLQISRLYNRKHFMYAKSKE